MNVDYKVFIGNRIKEYRERKNLSQEELAKKLGYSSKTSISKIESGEARIPSSKLTDFSRVLGVTIHELIAEDNTELFLEQTQYNASALATQFESMQNILRMLSRMDAKKIQQIESIIKTFVEE